MVKDMTGCSTLTVGVLQTAPCPFFAEQVLTKRMCYREGSPPQICVAAPQGLPASVVKNRLHRAMGVSQFRIKNMDTKFGPQTNRNKMGIGEYRE